MQDLVGPTLGGRYRLLGSAFGVQMHQAQCLTDPRVSERAKPARAPTQQRRLNATAHGLDKEDFGQSVDDRGRPRQVLRGFGGNELQSGLEPRRGTRPGRGQVENRREVFHEQVALR